MTTEDRCAPIRTLLDGLNGQPTPRPSRCGGAIVPVTKDTHQAYARRFDVDWAAVDLPEAGIGAARVACSNDVLETRGVTGQPVQLALCARCSGIESSVRAILAAAAARAEGGPR